MLTSPRIGRRPTRNEAFSSALRSPDHRQRLNRSSTAFELNILGVDTCAQLACQVPPSSSQSPRPLHL